MIIICQGHTYTQGIHRSFIHNRWVLACGAFVGQPATGTTLGHTYILVISSYTSRTKLIPLCYHSLSIIKAAPVVSLFHSF